MENIPRIKSHSTLKSIQKPQPKRFQGHFVKDYNFYSGNVNMWNKPARCCDKTFKFFHKDNISKNLKVEAMEAQYKEFDKQQEFLRKKEFVNFRRRQVRKLMEKRKIERLLVQKESSQLVEPQADDDLCETVEGLENEIKTRFKLNKSGFRNLFRGNRDNKWNDLTFTSKKMVDLILPEFCIRKDEQAIQRIMGLIKEEKDVKEVEKIVKQHVHDEIYEYQKSLKSVNDTNSYNKSISKSYNQIPQSLNATKAKKFETTHSKNPSFLKNKIDQNDIENKILQEELSIEGTRQADENENTLGTQNIKFERTVNGNTGYNSTFGNSTFNKTQNKTITLKFNEKTIRLQNESQSRLSQLCIDQNDKSSIGVGFYKHSLSTNKLGKYLRPKSRLIKIGESSIYDTSLDTIEQGKKKGMRRAASQSIIKRVSKNKGTKPTGIRGTQSQANLESIAKFTTMNNSKISQLNEYTVKSHGYQPSTSISKKRSGRQKFSKTMNYTRPKINQKKLNSKTINMSDYPDFKGLILSKIDLNTIGLNIPYVEKVVGGSEFLRSKLLKDLENSTVSKRSEPEKSIQRMKVELPKIKTKFPLQKEYGRVTVYKEAKNLDDPNVVMEELEEFDEMLSQTKNWLPDYFPTGKSLEDTKIIEAGQENEQNNLDNFDIE